MKIACIGNMNNTMFCITRYLRDKGFETDLLLLGELSQFSCDSDSYNETYKSYTFQLNWYDLGHWKISKKQIRNDLKKYDFFIGTDYAPAYLSKADINLDIFVPHGGDIYFHTKYKIKNWFPQKHEIGAKYRAYHQRKGIRNSKSILYDYIDDELLKIEERLIPPAKRFFSPSPHLYYKQYYTNEFHEQKSTTLYYEKICELRKQYDFIVLNHNRLNWTKPEYGVHLKGSDVLIRGFAEFLKTTNSNSLLILFEYGMDIQQTKDLIKSLGIEPNINWFPISGRKNIIPVIEQVDIVTGNLHASAMTYGCSMEALCMKKPLIAYRNDSLYSKTYEEIYPIINVATISDVCKKLIYYSTNKNELIDMGRKGHDWFLKYLIDNPLKFIANRIQTKARDSVQ